MEYAGSGDEQEIVGPNLLAVSPDDAIYIFDPVGKRILIFKGEARAQIDLTALDITSVTAMAATSDQLLLVEIFFQPVRNRVHWLAVDGSIVKTVELPEGFRLEDGLSGLRASDPGEVHVEFAGGAWFGRVTGEQVERVETLLEGANTVVSETPDLRINGTLLTADLTLGLGGLRYLGTSPAGEHVVVREDVLTLDPRFVVLTTVEWYSQAGELLGSARVPPLEEQAISSPPGVALLGNGRVAVLTALDEVVQVTVLERLEDERILSP